MEDTKLLCDMAGLFVMLWVWSDLLNGKAAQAQWCLKARSIQADGPYFASASTAVITSEPSKEEKT